jgi:hypothetical protein
MSVFKVKLINQQQGTLGAGVSGAGLSLGATVFVTGPDGVTHRFKDGDTFTASNWWKQFSETQTELHRSFLTVLTDDGSVFVAGERTPIPYSWDNFAVNTGVNFTVGVDIIAVIGVPADYLQVTPTVTMKMRINGNANATIDLPANATQIFNPGDLKASNLQFANASGTNGTIDIFVTGATPQV